MNDRIRRLAPNAVLLAVVASFAVAGVVARERTHPSPDPANVIAGPESHPASQGSGADVDDCTATGGFWGPSDDPNERASSRPPKLECKRYS